MNKLSSIISNFITFESDELVRTILYGDNFDNFDNDFGFEILTATINFIKQTQRFLH